MAEIFTASDVQVDHMACPVAPTYPNIFVHLSTEDARSFETDTVLLTVQARVPLEVMDKTSFVGDLFKDMFDG